MFLSTCAPAWVLYRHWIPYICFPGLPIDHVAKASPFNTRSRLFRHRGEQVFVCGRLVVNSESHIAHRFVLVMFRTPPGMSHFQIWKCDIFGGGCQARLGAPRSSPRSSAIIRGVTVALVRGRARRATSFRPRCPGDSRGRVASPRRMPSEPRLRGQRQYLPSRIRSVHG